MAVVGDADRLEMGRLPSQMLETIAKDAELLEIYTDALTEHITPFAELSARAYYACLALFVKLDDPQWGEWAHYCDARGAEVVDTFELEPPEPADESKTLTQLVAPR